MTDSVLDNIVWHSLTGSQAHLARGTAVAKRLAPGFSPLLGFADAQRPDFSGLETHCAPGEQLYCIGWTGAAPPGWRVDLEVAGLQMVRDGPAARQFATFACTRLAPEHVPQMTALVEATQPGPYGERNIELGEYVGVFDDGRLVAMAGHRLAAGALREISAVCTLPRCRGRGLSGGLVGTLLDLQLRRGQTPFLHVLRDNTVARALYERLGFRTRLEVPFRVVSRLP